ncbi:ABC-2 transporter permease [Thermococcus zilligii]|uniref:ABC-2 transporter permease n=1 Tax=Thermococcus zilligii TaxID=54076 RepID=UPI00029AAF33|nr:ABC-2 transporter permease [Thermococcus zilligii]
MGRLYTLFKWEMNDLIKAILLFVGVFLIGMSMKQSMMWIMSISGGGSGVHTELLLSLFGTSRSDGVGMVIYRSLSLDDVWTLMSFLILLLGALTFRYDRDSGIAKSVYSLPYSNDEIFGAKLLSFLVYGFAMILIPFAYVALTTHASIAGYLPEITSSFLGNMLIIVVFLVLYMTSVATLVSLASPNAFLAFMAGFALIYAPKILENPDIPPQLFMYALRRSPSSNFTPFTSQYLGWGILVPLVLFVLSWILIRRRDVV